MPDKTKLEQVNAIFDNLFNQTVDLLIEVELRGPGSLGVWWPEGDEFDVLTASDMARKVAETSNVYTVATKMAGMAAQEVTRAKQEYEYVYKTNKLGKNEDERTRNAMEASQEQAEQLTYAQRMYDFANRFADGARVASETARKLLDKYESIQIGDGRERHGQQRSEPVQSYNPQTRRVDF